ncbi:MAG: MarR family transcriptional regulator [Caldimonas sp.]
MNIRATELSLLALVCENDGIGPAQVASGLGVSRPRVSQCLDFLHHRQLLERHPSSSDGRGQHLHATAAGRSLVNEACRRLTQAEAAALQCFSKAERTLMVELLARLTASVV